MVMYFYQLAPIDYNWDEAMSVDQLFHFMAKCDVVLGRQEELVPFICEKASRISALFNELELVLEIAKSEKHGIGWEGDAWELRYLALPPACLIDHDAILEHCWIWKQENNGSCFIASTIHIYGHDENIEYSIVDLEEYKKSRKQSF